MSKVRRFLVAMVPVAAVLVTMGVSAGTASASVNVVTAIHHEDLVVTASGAVDKLRNLEASEPGNKHKIAAAVELIAHKFSRAATYVSHSSVDSAAQAAGRRNWVEGVHEVADGFYRLGRGLHDEIRGVDVNGARLALSAESKIRKGSTLLYKADRELGLRRGQ